MNRSQKINEVVLTYEENKGKGIWPLARIVEINESQEKTLNPHKICKN